MIYIVLSIDGRTFVWPIIDWTLGWITLILTTIGGRMFAVLIIYFLEVMKFLTVIVVVKVAQAVPNWETVAARAWELSTIAFVE